jgi:hypothetical protein
VIVVRVLLQFCHQLVVVVRPNDEPAIATHRLHDHGDLLGV